MHEPRVDYHSNHVCLKTHTITDAKPNSLNEPTSNLAVNPDATTPTAHTLSPRTLTRVPRQNLTKTWRPKLSTKLRVSETTETDASNLKLHSRLSIITDTAHRVPKPWPPKIADLHDVSWRPQSRKIRPQTSRLTSCPHYGPGLLLRTLSGRRPSLTRRRRRRPVHTTCPGTYPAQRGGTRTGRRICHATSQNVKGLRFSDDSPLGSP